MIDFNEEPVFSGKVLEILTVANEYCLYVEKAEEYKKQDILEYLQKLLPLIYLKLSLLPDIEVTDENASEHFVTEEQWENIFNTMRGKLGDLDQYFGIDLHIRLTHEVVQYSIAEALADIYQDMKDFVILYQKPLKISKENAVHECKQVFQTRTGYRLVNVIQIIHHLLYTETSVSELAEFEDIF